MMGVVFGLRARVFPTLRFSQSPFIPTYPVSHNCLYVTKAAPLWHEHYDTLETHRQADKKTIKAQYYKLSKKYHPDLNPHDDHAHHKFLLVNEAYAILGNEHRRREYDSSLSYHSTHTTSSATAAYGPGMGSQSAGAAAWRQSRGRSKSHRSSSVTAEAARKAGSPFAANQKTQFNFREHSERHYEEEERREKERDQARAANASLQQEAMGKDGPWVRFWKIGLLFSAIVVLSGLAELMVKDGVRFEELEKDDEDVGGVGRAIATEGG